MDGEIEVVLPYGCGVSARAGIRVHHGVVPVGEIVERHGLPLTCPLRTCFDLAGTPPLVEALVATDRALHRRLVELKQLQTYIARHSKSPGLAQARRVAEPATESPMETCLRLLLILAGLPRPKVQASLKHDLGRFLG
jgi:hypothetical protein